MSFLTIVYNSGGAEWYLEKRGSRKVLAGSRNLGSVFDKSRSLVFSGLFYFFESRKFSPKGLGLGFLTRISASRRVSDFTIRHPLACTTSRKQNKPKKNKTPFFPQPPQVFRITFYCTTDSTFSSRSEHGRPPLHFQHLTKRKR